MISITQPDTKTYCGIHELFFKDHKEQTKARSPKGPNIFTPKINQLSQSKPRGLPLHKPNPGHENNAIAKENSDNNSSVHAKILNIQISDAGITKYLKKI
jgi:hypothetical protein